MKYHLEFQRINQAELKRSKRTGTCNCIEIQFRSINPLSHLESFLKLIQTLCPRFLMVNEYVSKIFDRNRH